MKRHDDNFFNNSLMELGYSFRRAFIDDALVRFTFEARGAVLDLGGKQANRRGKFTPPKEMKWVYLNINPADSPNVIANGEQLPFRNSSFDAVACVEVLEFIDHPKELVSEIHRVLRPHGKLFLTEPFLFRMHGRPHDLQRFTDVMLRRLTGDLFDVIQLEAQGNYFTVLSDFLKQGLANLHSRMLRYGLSLMILPFVVLLYWLSRRKFAQESEFSISFTTGFVLIAQKKS